MTDLTIITNHVPRDVIYGYELTEDERKEFDYRDFDADDGATCSFVRYKGQLYDLGDMMRAELDGWDAIVNETFFSGVLFRYPREEWGELDSEHIICGRYYT